MEEKPLAGKIPSQSPPSMIRNNTEMPKDLPSRTLEAHPRTALSQQLQLPVLLVQTVLHPVQTKSPESLHEKDEIAEFLEFLKTHTLNNILDLV